MRKMGGWCSAGKALSLQSPLRSGNEGLLRLTSTLRAPQKCPHCQVRVQIKKGLNRAAGVGVGGWGGMEWG